MQGNARIDAEHPIGVLFSSRLAPLITEQEDDMSETAGTVLRASRLRMELAG